ncbi:MAG: glutaminase [Cytophagales bacterium]
MQQNFEEIIQEIYLELKDNTARGTVASYIPELSHIDPLKYGIHVSTLQGNNYSAGDAQEKFSIQSISKVFATTLAFSKLNEQIWERVGVEPSGTKFNSLIQLELENGIPRNPFINAGAIVMADILLSTLPNPKNDFLKFVRVLANTNDIDYNFSVVESEQATGFRNAALVNFMKSYGNIHNDVNEVLEFYFHMCSVEMTCKQLADSFLLYANHGLTHSGTQILTASQTKRLNALMQTCGFYDEAGEFSYKVGLPGKSGVGGGIAAVCPRQYAVAVWSPGLNNKGNSVLGMKTLELLTTKTGYSIF